MGAEFVVLPLVGIVGFAVVYYCILRFSMNDWMGKVPPGPHGFPLLGCMLRYLRSTELLSEVEECFYTHGSIFQMRAARQKIVFVKDSSALHLAAQEFQIESRTISDLASALQRCGLPYVKRRELQFIQRIWDTNARLFFSDKEDDLRLIQLISEKICEEDTLQSINNGEIKDVPHKLDITRVSSVVIDVKEHMLADFIENFRCLLLENPQSWISHWIFYLFNIKIYNDRRSKGRYYYEGVKEYIDLNLNLLNIHTERKFLLLLFLLVKFSNRNHLSQSDILLGPDIGGWRSFQAQEYAEVSDYNIPKYTYIYAK